MTDPGQSSMLLTLHAVRLLGFADTASVAHRFRQDPGDVELLLIDAGVREWAVSSSFSSSSRGWSLTMDGRAENERLLAEQLNSAGGQAAVNGVLADFGALNEEVVAACSRLQLEWLSAGYRPNRAIDAQTHQRFTRALTSLIGLEARLTAVLTRFGGYTDRLRKAVENAATDKAWLTATDRDSFHRIWFELHEDLIATLSIQR